MLCNVNYVLELRSKKYFILIQVNTLIQENTLHIYYKDIHICYLNLMIYLLL